MPNTQRIFRIVNKPLRILRIMGKSGAGVITWNLVTSDVTMSGDNGYSIQKVGGVCLATLPVTCPFGKTIIVDGLSANGWQINQNAGQYISNSGITSTTGIGHGIKSTYANDSITMICVIANTAFKVINLSGLPTFY